MMQNLLSDDSILDRDFCTELVPDWKLDSLSFPARKNERRNISYQKFQPSIVQWFISNSKDAQKLLFQRVVCLSFQEFSPWSRSNLTKLTGSHTMEDQSCPASEETEESSLQSITKQHPSSFTVHDNPRLAASSVELSNCPVRR